MGVLKSSSFSKISKDIPSLGTQGEVLSGQFRLLFMVLENTSMSLEFSNKQN